MNPAQRAALKAKVAEAKTASRAPAKLPPAPTASELELDKLEFSFDNQPDLRITYTCGHNEPLKNLTSRKCDACRQADKQKKAREKREKQLAGTQTPKAKYHESQRLPDGSVFCVDYIAEKQEWHGHLHIGGSGPKFEERAGGVFRLLMKLDTLYREHVAKSTES